MRNLVFFVVAVFFISCSGNENKMPAKIDSVISSVVAKDSVAEKDSVQPNVIEKDSVDRKNKGTEKTNSKIMVDTVPAFEIKGTVYYTLSYCGGAKPTDEIIRELATPKLFVNSTFMLRNKDSKYRIQTDQNGGFTASLPAGHFDVYFTKGTNLSIISGTANSCNNCLTEKTGTVNIIADEKAKINIAFHCTPEDAKRP
jgi:hypothetical protein